MLPRLLIVLALLAAAGLPASRAFAAEGQTITVSAVGEAEARPDTLVLSGLISESSPKMKDAVTAFNDTRRRALSAVNEVGLENLEITTSALSISLANGMSEFNDFGIEEEEEPLPEGALTVSQSVTLTVKGLAEMEEKAVIDLVVSVIDAAREAGINLSAMDQQTMMLMRMGWGAEMPDTAAVFKLGDPEALRKEATRAAMDKARADAQFLAELAGGKLGRVVAISDGPAGDDEQFNPYAAFYGMMEEEIEFGSSSFEPIKVVRALSVKFELILE